jgi:hypothetical protein
MGLWGLTLYMYNKGGRSIISEKVLVLRVTFRKFLLRRRSSYFKDERRIFYSIQMALLIVMTLMFHTSTQLQCCRIAKVANLHFPLTTTILFIIAVH